MAATYTKQYILEFLRGQQIKLIHNVLKTGQINKHIDSKDFTSFLKSWSCHNCVHINDRFSVLKTELSNYSNALKNQNSLFSKEFSWSKLSEVSCTLLLFLEYHKMEPLYPIIRMCPNFGTNFNQGEWLLIMKK